MDSELISFIIRSKNRQKILELLLKSEKTVAQIVKDTDMYTTHTHRTIRELKERKLITKTNPKDKNYNFYKTTPMGKQVLSDVIKIKKEFKYK